MIPERMQKIVKALEERGANKECSRCGGKKFSIIEESRLDIQTGPGIQIGGPAVPVVLIGCNQCGCIYSHALQLLGITSGTEG